MNLAPNFCLADRDRTEYRNKMAEHFAGQGFTHTLSLAWNNFVTENKIRADIRRLLAHTDEHFLGRWFYKFAASERTHAVFFLEKLTTNPHAHGLLRIPAKRMIRFHRLYPGEKGGIWNDIVKSGSYRLRVISDDMVAARYVTKEQHMNREAGSIIWSEEFMPRTR